jgi:hypothetical protein
MVVAPIGFDSEEPRGDKKQKKERPGENRTSSWH